MNVACLACERTGIPKSEANLWAAARATGKTLAENLEGVPDLKEGQQVIMPLEQPIKASRPPAGACASAGTTALEIRTASTVHLGLRILCLQLGCGPTGRHYQNEPIWGPLQILYGNLAPEGCVGKITGKEGLLFEGVARVYDSEEDMLAALSEDPQSFKVRHHAPFSCAGPQPSGQDPCCKAKSTSAWRCQAWSSVKVL